MNDVLVDETYYNDTYEGKAVEGFSHLSKQAERAVSTLTNYADWDKLTEKNTERVKTAICMLIEHENDVTVAKSELQGGFSIGSFSVSATADLPDGKQVLSDVSDVLFPTGLLYRGVGRW